MAAAGRDAKEQSETLHQAIAGIAQDPRTPREKVALARLSLSFARQAYQQAEPSIFYVNPDSIDELSALPDPLLAGTSRSEAARLGQLAASLESLDALLAARSAHFIDQAIPLWLYLDAETSSLRDALAGLSDPWSPDLPATFRQRYFLASPPTAIARIFQGVLAVTGDLLPGYWLDPEAAWSDHQPPLAEISGRFRAVRNIYTGRSRHYGNVDGPGLFDLVREQSPPQAEQTLETLERSLSIAERLALHPGDPAQARRILLIQAAEATRDLIMAARAVGIMIVEISPPAEPRP